MKNIARVELNNQDIIYENVTTLDPHYTLHTCRYLQSDN